MSAVVRSTERLPAEPKDRPEAGANQRRIDEAFCLIGIAAVRIVADPSPAAFVFDLASQDGVLQAVWCREENLAAPLRGTSAVDHMSISAGAFGPANAERYLRVQKALAALMLELVRPDADGSATLRFRGMGGEIADEIRAESRRQWRF